MQTQLRAEKLTGKGIAGEISTRLCFETNFDTAVSKLDGALSQQLPPQLYRQASQNPQPAGERLASASCAEDFVNSIAHQLRHLLITQVPLTGALVGRHG